MALSLSGQPGKPPFSFEKIVFHTTQCFGSCPVVDMEIDSNRNVVVHRVIFKGKGRGHEDDGLSGNFKGTIDVTSYKRLIDTLVASNYANLKFPAEFCCDAPVISIIVYANGQRTEMSSMFPPEEARPLINLLKGLGVGLRLQKT